MFFGSRVQPERYHTSAVLSTFAMSSGKFVVGIALAAGLTATLQGCGGGGTITTPAPAGSTRAPTPATWKWELGKPRCSSSFSTSPCTQVSTKEALAASFTKSFQDFDPKNPDGTELGVYMTMQTDGLRLYCGASNASDGADSCASKDDMPKFKP